MDLLEVGDVVLAAVVALTGAYLVSPWRRRTLATTPRGCVVGTGPDEG